MNLAKLGGPDWAAGMPGGTELGPRHRPDRSVQRERCKQDVHENGG